MIVSFKSRLAARRVAAKRYGLDPPATAIFLPRLWSRSSRAAFSTAYSPDNSSDILVVGGGPTGLVTALLLARHGIPSTVIEQQSVENRFRHPQAHFMNTRTMEILRSHLPEVYNSVRQAMPDVSTWQHFEFVGEGGILSFNNNDRQQQSKGKTSDPRDKPLLARVQHPVHMPLQAGVDSNGILLDSNTSNGDHVKWTRTADLSPCTVGHLAQHTFGRILYDHAAKDDIISLKYQEAVESITSDQRHVQIVTNSAKYKPRLLIAADGAHSIIRNSLGITQSGKHNIQHLMNIHVKLSPQLTQKYQHDTHAMLYTVFSPLGVAMVVCHSPANEYIVQLPYFPPHQDANLDFGPEFVHHYINQIFGFNTNVSNNNNSVPFEILSVKPWIMNALVADTYVKHFADTSVALVGDAAHVFPPAGGFGMNTGVQDAHNLATKLACLYRYPSGEKCEMNSDNDIRNREQMRWLLSLYEKERRPVAVENAALSVRNFQRVLQIMKSCYLNDQHPQLLQKGLLSVPLLSASQARTVFQSMLKTALYPFSWLQNKEASSYYRLIRHNLRSVLKEGVGLPLLFPKHELMFTYSTDENNVASSNGEKSDSFAPIPTLGKGKLLPHSVAKVMSRPVKMNKLQFLPNHVDCISTCDLPAQVVSDNDRSVAPSFVVIHHSCNGLQFCVDTAHSKSRKSAADFLIKLCTQLETELNVHIAPVLVVKNVKVDVVDETTVLVLQEVCNQDNPLQFRVTDSQGFLLLRPDGHISYMTAGNIEDNSNTDWQQLREILYRDMYNTVMVELGRA